MTTDSTDRDFECCDKLPRIQPSPFTCDLDAIVDKWLQQCGPCDGGLPMGCSHPNEDYRPVMAALVYEIERLRERLLVKP